jgi:hypothetical protein
MKNKLQVIHLKTFGCFVYIHVPKEYRNKLKNKTCKCLFIGYNDRRKVYWLFEFKKKTIMLSKDVMFDETKITYLSITNLNVIYHSTTYNLPTYDLSTYLLIISPIHQPITNLLTYRPIYLHITYLFTYRLIFWLF